MLKACRSLASYLGILACFLLRAIPVEAWDQHHYLTAEMLKGFELRDPALWQTLNTPVRVTPLESLIQKAFGPACTSAGMRDQVMEGLGRRYSVQFTEGAEYDLDLLWETGNSVVHYRFQPANSTSNSQAPGNLVLPRQVLTIYSDEPDWEMDDDVLRLKDVGISRGIEGLGTRILRHFWYKGENQFGNDLSEGQELDRRVQLLYELSLVAFSVDEPYWGYRFLGNALHYLQDLTQPFHVKAVINDNMIYSLDFVRAQLCEWNPSPTCSPQETLQHALIKTGWLIGTYHAIFEDFGRGLLASNYHASNRSLSDTDRFLEKHSPISSPTFPRDSRGFLSLRPTVEQTQQLVLEHAEETAALLYQLFGKRYRLYPEESRRELRLGGTAQSVGQRLAEADYYSFPLTERQRQAKSSLLELTHQYFQQNGTWGREFIRQALATPNPNQEGQILVTRLGMASRCAKN